MFFIYFLDLHKKMSSSSGGDSTEDDHTPLWRYVTKLEKGPTRGNCTFQCNYCMQIFKGSYYRVKAHLLRMTGHGIKVCPKVTPTFLMEMQKVANEASLRLKNAAPKHVPLPSASSKGSSSSGTSIGMGMRLMAVDQGTF